jgi:hypothetical protein
VAFPVIEAVNGMSNTTASTTQTVPMPAGVAAGDLLIVGVSIDGAASTLTWPAGWDVLVAITQHGTGSERTEVRSREADGSEGASIAITSSNEEASAWSLRISGWGDVEAAAPVSTDGDATPDPPNLAPAAGAQDYLWLAGCGFHITVTCTKPTDYDMERELLPNLNGTPRCQIASRELNAASEDPSNFTLSAGSFGQVAYTIAVHPATDPVGTGTMLGVGLATCLGTQTHRATGAIAGVATATCASVVYNTGTGAMHGVATLGLRPHTVPIIASSLNDARSTLTPNGATSTVR